MKAKVFFILLINTLSFCEDMIIEFNTKDNLNEPSNLKRSASYMITTLNDSGPGSLRDALENQVDNYTINFSPDLSGSIVLERQLPDINSNNVSIIGVTDINLTPKVAIDATNLSIELLAPILKSLGTSTNITNLALINGYYGIFVQGGDATISNCYIGTANGITKAPTVSGIHAESNVIIQNCIFCVTSYCIYIEATNNDITNATISNNLIGVDKTGVAPLNVKDPQTLYGIVVMNASPFYNISGVDITGNTISGFSYQGIMLFAEESLSRDTTRGEPRRNQIYFEIRSNYIGTDNVGSANSASTLSNEGGGIKLQSSGGTISGIIANNVISNNSASGIIGSGYIDDITITGNKIGVAANGVSPLGNAGSGILIEELDETYTQNITIGSTNFRCGNIIAYNYQQYDDVPGVGVNLKGEAVNLISILGNSIYANETPQGILLELGANNSQQPPIISSVQTSTNSLTISGQSPAIGSGQDVNLRLEFFYTPVNYALSNPQGKTFLGAIDPIAPNTTFTQNFTLPQADIPYYITSTATALDNSGSYGNTSEFSDAISVGPELSDFDIALIVKYYDLLV